MQIIRQASFAATPWKNGGGITHEVIRVPEGPGAFRWRLSVARIEASGPFSDFSGYRRFMVLLRGGGVRLEFADGTRSKLRAVGEMTRFDGALAAQGLLLAGPCTDLNLIVSTSITGVRAWVERLRTPQALEPGPGTALVFPISGALSLQTQASRVRLEPWDFASTSAEDRAAVAPASDAALVFFAVLDDNPR